MEGSRWISFGKRMLYGAAYCAAYWLLWHVSFDQWFLPAGLRAAVFLLSPFRYWPFLLAGDAAALTLIRAPMADDYNAAWAHLSPFLLAPLVASLVFVFRKKFPTTSESAQWIPLIGICLAAWGTLANVAINLALSGPPSFDTIGKALNFAVGNYLGILLVALPCYFSLLRKQLALRHSKFLKDSIVAALIVAALYLLTTSGHLEQPVQQSILMLMLVPAVWLTFVHGWQGAALGIFVVDLAIAQTMTYTGQQAARDNGVFQAQFALSIAASALLAFGAKISHLFDNARQLGISEKYALEMTRSSLLMGERNLREQVLYMAQMQIFMDDKRKQLVDLFKSQGKFADAMQLNSEAVEHMQSFERRASAIYPMKLEELGLYGVIFPETFTDFWAGDADVVFVRAVGQPSQLSVDLQLTAYRCICNAFSLLTQGAPELFRVKLRTWKRGHQRGIFFEIAAAPTQPFQITESGTLAEIDLERRVKAYGGALGRRRLHRVHVLLWEPVDAESPTDETKQITAQNPPSQG